MSKLAALLAEMKEEVVKTAEAPSAPSVNTDDGNKDVLNLAGETLAKIQNFFQASQGMSEPAAVSAPPGDGSVPPSGQAPTSGTGSRVTLEVPEGAVVKVASFKKIANKNDAIEALLGFMPEAFI